MIHYSKKDWWLMALIVVTIVAMTIGGVSVLVTESEDTWVGLVLLGSAALTAWLVGSISYEITATELIIRCAMFRVVVQIEEIQEIFPTRNPLSSPALSLDRIRINYLRNSRMKFVMISPQDKASFMNDLVEVDSQLTVADDRLERAS